MAQTYKPTQEQVNAALANLRAAEKNPQNPTIAKAKISSAKNAKGNKIKVKINKLDSVTGYQIKYSNNSKFKNKKKKKNVSKTVKTTKTTYTTKKISPIKKNKKAYIKVRGYKKVNGVVVYGAWSTKKAVKIKK